jgi:uncharacterized protein (DUF1330 family)
LTKPDIFALTVDALDAEHIQIATDISRKLYLLPVEASKVLEAQKAAGARPLRTAGGKIVAMEGTAPKRVAITEFDSLEQAEAFYKSKAWNDLASERNKAVKTIKRYAVEVLP